LCIADTWWNGMQLWRKDKVNHVYIAATWQQDFIEVTPLGKHNYKYNTLRSWADYELYYPCEQALTS
jgi:hypothetical protein